MCACVFFFFLCVCVPQCLCMLQRSSSDLGVDALLQQYLGHLQRTVNINYITREEDSCQSHHSASTLGIFVVYLYIYIYKFLYFDVCSHPPFSLFQERRQFCLLPALDALMFLAASKPMLVVKNKTHINGNDAPVINRSHIDTTTAQPFASHSPTGGGLLPAHPAWMSGPQGSIGNHAPSSSSSGASSS